jgi:Ca2+/Na+ antiporter
MNDAIYEHIVPKKASPKDLIKRLLVILLLAFIFFIFLGIVGPFAVVLVLILGFLAHAFIFTRLNVEYEYTLLNHDMDVDAIYSKQKRKRLLSFDFQKAEIIAPKNSPRLNAINIEKTYDFSSNDPENRAFAIIIPIQQKRTCVIIEPDQGMINHMRPWMGSKFYFD